MNNKLALQILSLTFSEKKVGFPYNLKEVWYQVFPLRDFPKNEINSLGIKTLSEDYDKAKEILFNEAVDYLSAKLSD